MKNNNISSIARKLFHQQRGVRRVRLMNPKRDWIIGLLVGLFIMVVMAGWSAFVYFIQRDDISLDNSEAQAYIPLYKADLVAEALDIFDAKAERFAELTPTNQAPVVDLVVNETDVQTATTTATSTATSVATTTPEIVPPEEQLSPETQIETVPDDLGENTETGVEDGSAEEPTIPAQQSF